MTGRNLGNTSRSKQIGKYNHISIRRDPGGVRSWALWVLLGWEDTSAVTGEVFSGRYG